MKAIRAGNCGLVLVDSAASAATKKKYLSVCSHAGVRMAVLPENLLAEATGRPGVAMAILQGGLAERMMQMIPAQDREFQPMKSGNKCGGACVE